MGLALAVAHSDSPSDFVTIDIGPLKGALPGSAVNKLDRPVLADDVFVNSHTTKRRADTACPERSSSMHHSCTSGTLAQPRSQLAGRARHGERVLDQDAIDNPARLKILGQDPPRAGDLRGFDDKRIPERKAASLRQL